MRYFLEISYTGTRYRGWQLQPRENTVQAQVNRTLSLILSKEIRTFGCGRTDAGVHAAQFFLHFDAEINLSKRDFLYKCNRLLPPDIAVKNLFEVAADARSRQDATQRTYNYHLHLRKDPFLTDFSFYYPFGKPDFEKLQEVAAFLKKNKDFKALSKTDTVEKTSICNIFHSGWKKNGSNRLCYTITADHFLRGMVRLCVGAMLNVAVGKTTLHELQTLVKKKDHIKTLPAVPGCGLTLTKVDYPYI